MLTALGYEEIDDILIFIGFFLRENFDLIL